MKEPQIVIIGKEMPEGEVGEEENWGGRTLSEQINL